MMRTALRTALRARSSARPSLVLFSRTHSAHAQ
jgi:hypothetical protein